MQAYRYITDVDISWRALEEIVITAISSTAPWGCWFCYHSSYRKVCYSVVVERALCYGISRKILANRIAANMSMVTR